MMAPISIIPATCIAPIHTGPSTEPTNNSNKKRVGGALTVKYKFTDKLSAQVNAGTDFYTFNFENFYDKYTPSRDGGILQLRTITMKEENYQAMINYVTPLFGDFKLNAMAGGNMMRARNTNREITGQEDSGTRKGYYRQFQDSAGC